MDAVKCCQLPWEPDWGPREDPATTPVSARHDYRDKGVVGNSKGPGTRKFSMAGLNELGSVMVFISFDSRVKWYLVKGIEEDEEDEKGKKAEVPGLGGSRLNHIGDDSRLMFCFGRREARD